MSYINDSIKEDTERLNDHFKDRELAADLAALREENERLRAAKRELVDENEVLEIVDSCFHCFASSFRNDAKIEAQELFAAAVAKHREGVQAP